MKKLISRYIVLFLVFLVGFTLRDSWPDIVAYKRYSREASLALKYKHETRKYELELASHSEKIMAGATTELLLLQAKLKKLEEAVDAIPGIDREKQIQELQAHIDELGKRKGAAEANIASIEKELRQVDEKIAIQDKRLAEEQSTYTFTHLRASMCEKLCSNIFPAVAYVLAVLCIFISCRLFCFYVFAPFAENRRPVYPCGRGEEGAPKDICAEQGVKLVTVPLPPGETLLVRDESYTGGYMEYDDGMLEMRTQALFSRRYWLMSCLCGLCVLTRFSNAPNSARMHDIDITSDDPDEYFSLFNLEPGQRYFISPSDLVAFTGGVRIYARWRFQLAAWCMGQVRYYVLTGEGTVVVRAVGGTTARTLRRGETAVRKKHSLISATQGILLHVRRTETLVPYLLGNVSLFDLRLQGSGRFRIHNAITRPRSLTERTTHVFLESLGKFLGF